MTTAITQPQGQSQTTTLHIPAADIVLQPGETKPRRGRKAAAQVE